MALPEPGLESKGFTCLKDDHPRVIVFEAR